MKSTLKGKSVAKVGNSEPYNIEVICEILPGIDRSVLLTRTEMSEFGIRPRPKAGDNPRRPVVRVPFEKFSPVVQKLLEAGELPLDGVAYWQYLLALERHRNRQQHQR